LAANKELKEKLEVLKTKVRLFEKKKKRGYKKCNKDGKNLLS
jgi:hypothetical protein